MTAWLDWQEHILLHEKYIKPRLEMHLPSNLPTRLPPRLPPLVYPWEMKIATRALAYGVAFDEIQSHYKALDFVGVLSRFVIHTQHPELSRWDVDQLVPDFHIPFSSISVFHCIKFITQDPFSIDPSVDIVVDSVHCEPSQSALPGRFDTAIINHHNGGRAGMKGTVFVLIVILNSILSPRLLCWTSALCIHSPFQGTEDLVS